MNAATIQWQPATWAGPSARTNNTEKLDKKPWATQETAVLTGILAEKQDPSTMSDQLLMREIERGNRRALEAIYDRYVSGCYGLALKIVHNPSVAEEIVQDVFVKLWS